jgi:transcriptional regulator with XRE-family HTH domain
LPGQALSRRPETSRHQPHISTLSKIENGQVSPVYGRLRKIAVGLGIAFEQLISGHGQHHPRPYKLVFRSAQTADPRNAQYAYGMHAADLDSKAMLPMVITIDRREPQARAMGAVIQHCLMHPTSWVFASLSMLFGLIVAQPIVIRWSGKR